MIVFEISNYFDNTFKIPQSDHSGYGIINLKKRLELAYPGKYQLIIEPGVSLYNVKLTIDTNAD
jgi:hypothetical protein